MSVRTYFTYFIVDVGAICNVTNITLSPTKSNFDELKNIKYKLGKKIFLVKKLFLLVHIFCGRERNTASGYPHLPCCITTLIYGVYTFHEL